MSFSTGIFLDDLKLAKVIPLHKKGSTDDPTNYQPISLLSIFSDIIKKHTHKRLYIHLNAFFITSTTAWFSWETFHSLYSISLTESIKGNIDNGSHGCGIFIDLQNAFNIVNHQILLQKLEHNGIRGIGNCWFSLYLSARKQYVSVNGHTSDHLNISCGVPQGSVVGPLLFLLYINDLPNVSKLLTFYLFADGTIIYLSLPDLITLQNRLAANHLALNIDKTNCYFSFS